MGPVCIEWPRKACPVRRLGHHLQELNSAYAVGDTQTNLSLHRCGQPILPVQGEGGARAEGR